MWMRVRVRVRVVCVWGPRVCDDQPKKRTCRFVSGMMGTFILLHMIVRLVQWSGYGRIIVCQ